MPTLVTTPSPIAAQYLIVPQDAIVAHAGGGIGSATLIMVNPNAFSVARVVTVATTGDSCILDIAALGSWVRILAMWGTNAMQLFATGTDTINGNAGVVGVSLPGDSNGSVYDINCVSGGSWYVGRFWL